MSAPPEATTSVADAAQSRPPRTAAVWCPDWPVSAARAVAGVTGEVPVAVVTADRVVACNHAGREQGVRRGQRRREAQYRCPALVVLARDEVAEARLFEPVAVALESVAPGVEITRPGLAAIGVRGPARYYRGEVGVVAAVSQAVATVALDVLIGVADGAFAAGLAARSGAVVPAGGSPAFLAGLPITVFGSLAEVALVDLLLRLGLRTLGSFAALPARDVAARFGAAGVWAHRLAGGRDERPVAARRPPVDCTVQVSFEPPLDRSDAVAFSSRASAEQFIDRLAGRGLACVCFEAQVDIETGEQVVRRWRHTGLLTAGDVVDRIRWQLEGMLAGEAQAEQVSGGVSRLRLVPVETVPTGAHQQALWGGPGERDERVQRGLARVQTQFGHESVSRLFVQGGSSSAARTGRTVWEEPARLPRPAGQPWPGHLPAPAPAVLIDPPRQIQVFDQHSLPVTISDRGAVASAPARLRVDGRPAVAITAWAGPWPQSEAWWEPQAAGRVLRCQLVDVHGRAYVVAYHPATNPDQQPGPRWLLEGLYD